MNDKVDVLTIFALTTDPVYVGTGGYTIGRVDNTIVRDPTTKLPKIPGSSLAGTWRYYVTLELLSNIKEKQPEVGKVKNINKPTVFEKIKEWIDSNKDKWNFDHEDWKGFEGNVISRINCAGQDNFPQGEIANIDATNKEGKTGHCGHCIVCKGFGFSKSDLSWQGMLYFSDLNIIFFPVFTRLGTMWITTEEILKENGLLDENTQTKQEQAKICKALEQIEEGKQDGHINLGWLYLPYKVENMPVKLDSITFGSNFKLTNDKIIIVPEKLFSQIVNSNLEVRTSVSIDPITGAAKEGALFTSEAIPRGTIFKGTVRIFDKSGFAGLDNRLEPLPETGQLKQALCDSKHFFETLGIGGMTTRGFGRVKIEIKEFTKEKSPSGESEQHQPKQTNQQNVQQTGG